MKLILYSVIVLCTAAELLFFDIGYHWHWRISDYTSILCLQIPLIVITWLVCVFSMYVGGSLNFNYEMISLLGCWAFSLGLIWVSMIFTGFLDALAPKFRSKHVRKLVHKLQFKDHQRWLKHHPKMKTKK